MADQEGIVEIISNLEEEELYALAKTVTQGLLKIENTDGKIEILSISLSTTNSFQRR